MRKFIVVISGFQSNFSRSVIVIPNPSDESQPISKIDLLAAGLSSAADRRVVNSDRFPRVLGPYSHAVVAGGFVFIAGQAPINPVTQEFELGDIGSETRLELTNMASILEAAGSNLASVVKVSIHLASLDDFDGMNEAYSEFFPSNCPVRTTTQAVLRSGRKIEIDCIARMME
jgi:2-iminobutanoate/2-iminopropanoate deaminase